MISGQSSRAFHAKHSLFQQTHCRAPMEKRLGDTQQREYHGQRKKRRCSGYPICHPPLCSFWRTSHWNRWDIFCGWQRAHAETDYFPTERQPTGKAHIPGRKNWEGDEAAEELSVMTEQPSHPLQWAWTVWEVALKLSLEKGKEKCYLILVFVSHVKETSLSDDPGTTLAVTLVPPELVLKDPSQLHTPHLQSDGSS